MAAGDYPFPPDYNPYPFPDYRQLPWNPYVRTVTTTAADVSGTAIDGIVTGEDYGKWIVEGMRNDPSVFDKSPLPNFAEYERRLRHRKRRARRLRRARWWLEHGQTVKGVIGLVGSLACFWMFGG